MAVQHRFLNQEALSFIDERGLDTFLSYLEGLGAQSIPLFGRDGPIEKTRQQIGNVRYVLAVDSILSVLQAYSHDFTEQARISDLSSSFIYDRNQAVRTLQRGYSQHDGKSMIPTYLCLRAEPVGSFNQ
jgi:hypothetical protein